MIMKKRTANRYGDAPDRLDWAGADNQTGSAMVIALMVLLLLTLAGIAATNLAVTESFIVRNSGIHKQNLQLAEMAALEGLREILTRNGAEELIAGAVSAPVWIRDRNLWNNNPTLNQPLHDDSFPLTDNNSAAAQFGTLVVRGEAADEPLRYYFVGWRDMPGASLKMTGAMWRQGRVISVYDSDRFGLASVEVGVIKLF
jgi:hypothetical protein